MISPKDQQLITRKTIGNKNQLDDVDFHFIYLVSWEGSSYLEYYKHGINKACPKESLLLFQRT